MAQKLEGLHNELYCWWHKAKHLRNVAPVITDEIVEMQVFSPVFSQLMSQLM